jgi:hypothetical protein
MFGLLKSSDATNSALARHNGTAQVPIEAHHCAIQHNIASQHERTYIACTSIGVNRVRDPG